VEDPDDDALRWLVSFTELRADEERAIFVPSGEVDALFAVELLRTGFSQIAFFDVDSNVTFAASTAARGLFGDDAAVLGFDVAGVAEHTGERRDTMCGTQIETATRFSCGDEAVELLPLESGVACGLRFANLASYILRDWQCTDPVVPTTWWAAPP
jgi:hypothetical protein